VKPNPKGRSRGPPEAPTVQGVSPVAEIAEPATRIGAAEIITPLAVTVNVVSPAAASTGGPAWVFSATPSQLPLPASQPGSLRSWAQEHGGAPASGNYVEIELRALGPRPAIVDRLRVVVTRRRRAVAGTAVFLGTEAGGRVPRFLVADLDRMPISVRSTPGIDSAGASIPEVTLPHIVSRIETDVWRIQAQTASYDCDWVAYLDWRCAGRSGSIRLDDRGEPFRTAGIRRATRVTAMPESTQWSGL